MGVGAKSLIYNYISKNECVTADIVEKTIELQGKKKETFNDGNDDDDINIERLEKKVSG